MDVKRCSEVRRRMSLAQAALQRLVEADDARGDTPVFVSGAGRSRLHRRRSGLGLRFSALTTPPTALACQFRYFALRLWVRPSSARTRSLTCCG